MLKKAYLEITNACNLSCSFCHGTKRDIKYLTEAEFKAAAEKIRPHCSYLYFHLMGEPLLHPSLSRFFEIANDLGFKVIITTNGTLLKKREDILLSSPALHKVSISLHAYEANQMGISIESYLSDCFDFCRRASERGIISVMRLWNLGGLDEKNAYILDKIKAAFTDEWKEVYSGYKLSDKVFLEWGEKFDWPDIDGEELGCDHTCYGLRDQIGVLSNGTVVPCCLDADGAVPLGNIFESDLSDILSGERATALKTSLERRRVTEELCKRCPYARQKKY
ncbi:MAG: SPASM domain-containing protein [Clostridia bacterium]|nr:SPASM domain-containing protein [Clostridia bacterium]